MDSFTTHLERGFLRLRWQQSVEITEPIAVAAARELEHHSSSPLPLLVHMHGIAGVTPEARVSMATYRGFSRVALVGEDAIDEMVSGFAHRNPFSTRYFTSETEALAWLLDTETVDAEASSQG